MINTKQKLIGERFKVWQRPVTKEEYEGTARVVRVHGRYEKCFEATVRFPGEDNLCRRRINYDDHEPA